VATGMVFVGTGLFMLRLDVNTLFMPLPAPGTSTAGFSLMSPMICVIINGGAVVEPAFRDERRLRESARHWVSR
jgi:hypothetical protein